MANSLFFACRHLRCMVENPFFIVSKNLSSRTLGLTKTNGIFRSVPYDYALASTSSFCDLNFLNYGRGFGQRRTYATAVNKRMDPDDRHSEETKANVRKTSSISMDDLESEFSHAGRINSDRYAAFIDQLKDSSQTLTQDQSLILLRCCGNAMFAEPVDVRLNFVDKTWKLLPSLGIKYTTAHFNALLAVWLDNKYRFSVVDFLSQMDQQAENVVPDATTYRYLLERYCMDGDINGASTVLEHMKSKEFSITEDVFNSLVYCYSKIGDKEGLNNILNAMNSAGLRVNSTTYFNMALPFAETGDIKKITEIHAEASDSDFIGFSERDCFELAVTASMHGHSGILKEILAFLPRKPASMNKANLAALRLIVVGKFKDALTVSYMSHEDKKMDDQDMPEDESPAYTVYLLTTYKLPLRILQNFFEYLRKEKIYDQPHLRALYASLRHHDEDGSLEIIRHLRDHCRIVPRSSFFYPLIADYRKSGTWEETVDFLARISAEFNIHFQSWELEAFLSLVDETKKQELVTLSRKERNSKKVVVQKMETVYDDLDQENLTVEQLEKLVERMKSQGLNQKMALRRLFNLYTEKQDKAGVLKTVNELNAIGAEIPGTREQESVSLSRKERNSKKFVVQKKETICDDLDQESLTVEQLEKLVERMKSQGLNHKMALRRLVNLYAEKQDHAGVIKTVNELDAIGAELPESTLRAVVLAAARSGDSAASKETESLISKLIDSTQLDNVLKLFFSLANDRLIKESVFLMKFLERINSRGKLKRHQLDSMASNLIALNIEEVCAKLIDLNERQAANSIIQSATTVGFLKPNKKVIGGLIQTALEKNDTAEAADLFVDAAKKFAVSVCLQTLMVELIRRVDAKSLQKVFDQQQARNGETDAKFRLVMALCHCGKTDQAQKVWKAIDEKIPPKAIEEDFENYVDTQTYKNLAKLCRTSSNDYLDLNRVYDALFGVYRKKKDWKAAMVEWSKLEADKFVPSMDLYRLYARILRESNRPIPPEIEYNCTHGNNSRQTLKETRQTRV